MYNFVWSTLLMNFVIFAVRVDPYGCTTFQSTDENTCHFAPRNGPFKIIILLEAIKYDTVPFFFLFCPQVYNYLIVKKIKPSCCTIQITFIMNRAGLNIFPVFLLDSYLFFSSCYQLSFSWYAFRMIWRLRVQTPVGAIFDEIYFVLCNLRSVR